MHTIFNTKLSRIWNQNLKNLLKECEYDIRKYYFTERIVNIWNSLPDAVVNSSTVNQFKKNLDRHWSKKQEMMYDYRAELHGRGN